MEDVFAYMIGPKAENMTVFRKLVLEALDDQMFWRRNFYPEDLPVVSAHDQAARSYREFVDTLRDRLFEFLSEAKKGVPFFSPRYVGHMNTDLLLPALVGYFGAMLYNQNNVAGESSPVTVQLEGDVVRMLLAMVGMDEDRGWGYLCSGGTSANIYGLWVARNVRTQPMALRAALAAEPTARALGDLAEALPGVDPERLPERHRRVRAVLREELTVTTATGRRAPLMELDAWEIANVPLAELHRLRQRCVEIVAASFEVEPLEELDSRAAPAAAGVVVDHIVGPHTLRRLGEHRFRAQVAAAFPEGERGFFANPWHVYVAADAHYSWSKAADLLGLGKDCLVEIAHLPGFDMSPNALEDALRRDLSLPVADRPWPLMLVSDFGSTEHGALDDLPEVRRRLSRLADAAGLTLWHHVDAAYGGYLGAMIRRGGKVVSAGPIQTPGSLKHFLVECCELMGLVNAEDKDDVEINELIELSEHEPGVWLSWGELIDRTRALGDADSIALDPHKLGYIPYPAGAVILRDRAGREAVSSDAPYLWNLGDEQGGFVGRFTLEGSRAGATAAACWLAHRTIPLDQSGHGKLLALSILATRQLYLALTRRHAGEGKVGVEPVHRPHLNMICYVPYHAACASFAEAQELTNHVCQKLSPAGEVRPFMAVSTEVVLDRGWRPGQVAARLVMLPDSAEGKKVKVIRSVVMSPYALNAIARPARNGAPKRIFELYAQHLERLIDEGEQKLTTARALAKLAHLKRDLHFVVMDDDPRVKGQLEALVAELRHPAIGNAWRQFDSERAALDFIDDDKNRLDLVFLDVDMGAHGASDAGYRAYEAILRRNKAAGGARYRVQAVVFFSKGRADHQGRVDALRRRYPSVQLKTLSLDKEATGAGASDKERLAAVRLLVRQIADMDLAEVNGT